MRKSKITKLFDWEAYQTAQSDLTQSPEEKKLIKIAAEQDKALHVFQASVAKDLKIGLKILQEAVKKGEKAVVPYFLHLDYFANAKGSGGSLLILGNHPNIRKAFISAGKTPEKVNLSYGEVELEANNILRFVADKNGMKVKPKPLVEALKQAPISKSNPGFWSKRKVNNVIIGAAVAEELQDTLTGDSELVERSVNYSTKGSGSEVYDAFKSFVNRDYANSNGTRNSEYYAQTLHQVEGWLKDLQDEFKAKSDKKLKAAYQKMGKVMLAFKKKVQQEIQQDQAQYINENSALSSFEQAFHQTLEEYKTSEDAYQQSILRAKLERILLELKQQVGGDQPQGQASQLLQTLQAKFDGIDHSTRSNLTDSATQNQIDALFSELTNLLGQYEEAAELTI